MSKQWGQWHEGEVYDIRVEHKQTDTYPRDFRCSVEVRDKAAGTVTKYAGKGKYIGNFSPIWIKFKGESLQLTEILRMPLVSS